MNELPENVSVQSKKFSPKRVLKTVGIIVGTFIAIVALFIFLKVFFPAFAAVGIFLSNPPAEKGWADN